MARANLRPQITFGVRLRSYRFRATNELTITPALHGPSKELQNRGWVLQRKRKLRFSTPNAAHKTFGAIAVILGAAIWRMGIYPHYFSDLVGQMVGS